MGFRSGAPCCAALVPTHGVGGRGGGGGRQGSFTSFRRGAPCCSQLVITSWFRGILCGGRGGGSECIGGLRGERLGVVLFRTKLTSRTVC
jgi:hypothetical protein